MSNEIGGDYYHTMDRDYKQRVYQSRAGPHVFEDVEGKFTTSLPKWIRTGAESIELQLGQGKAGEMGPESYGKDAREELKKLAELSGVNVHTVHAPVSVQGLSGFDNREGKFSEVRQNQLINELGKTIDFAADVTNGSNIVFHMGEFPRSINETDSKFELYEEEEKSATVHFGNKSTGRPNAISKDIKIEVSEREDDGTPRRKEDGGFDIKERDWHSFSKELENLKKDKGEKEGKEIFINRHHLSNPEKWEHDLPSLALVSEYYQSQIEDIEAQEERWRGERDKIDEELKKARARGINEEEIKNYERERDVRLRLIVEQERKKVAQINTKNNLVPLKDLALPRSADAIAKAAITAYDRVQEKHLARPITLVPENLGPHEYGSHPDEMIEIVNKSRDAFVNRLTQKEIEDPRGLTDNKGKPHIIDNPYYRKEFAKDPKKAEELAKQYIKSTIDAQHLQMWQAHFKRESGETELEKEKRFYTWYDEQLRKLMESDVLGHVHVVDGMGRGHVHLPVGQGRIMEMSEAFDELRSMGLTMTHEGWMEGQARHLEKGWDVAGPSGQTIYGAPGGDYVLSESYHKHLGSGQPPRYFTPDETDFSSHPEDFKIWSEVPLE